MHKRILLCPPTFYTDGDVRNDKRDKKNGNTWRDIYRGVIDTQKAQKQWNRLYQLFLQEGVQVNLAHPHPYCISQVFVANAGLVYRNQVLLSKYKNPSRQYESKVNIEAFKQLGYQIIHSKYFFEGEGDAIFSHHERILWLGHGFRSDPRAAIQLQQIAPQSRVITLKLIDPLWYHLDTCFLPLHNNHLLLCPQAFDKSSLQAIYKEFPAHKIIPMSHQDSMQFACNSVLIQGRKIITYKMSSELKKRLRRWGYSIIETDMSEFIIAGGSVKCAVCNLSL